MKLRQVTGPFGANSQIHISNMNADIVHIGIQIPNRPPLSWQDDAGQWIGNGASQPDVYFMHGNGNKKGYTINKCGILEFDGELSDGEATISFAHNFPMNTIVDIIFKNANE